MAGLEFRVQNVGFKVQGSRLIERFKGMKNRRLEYFDFINNTPLDLRGKSGRKICKRNYLAVSAVKRAAEGEI